MMVVEVRNDGKGKHQSFTATIEIPHTYLMDGLFAGGMAAYGATSAEAIRNLSDVARAMSLAVTTAALELPQP